MSSLADRRTAALEAFERAASAGRGFHGDWAKIAAELAAVLPTSKAKVEIDRSAWADYKPPVWRQKGYERALFAVVMADGEKFEFHCPSDYRKPFNWGTAKRHAQDFWRFRISQRIVTRNTTSSHRYNRGYDPDEREAIERTLVAPAVVSMECNGVTCTAIPESM